MYHCSFGRQHRSGSMIPGAILCGVWLAGSSLGLWAARYHGDTLEPFLLTAGASALRFRDACMVTLAPLLLSALAVYFFHRTGAYLACFLRGLSLGFLLGVLMTGGGPWLAVLLPFSGLFFSPVLLWYLWRRLESGPRSAPRDAVFCVTAGLCLAAVDTWVVAPFLAAALAI